MATLESPINAISLERSASQTSTASVSRKSSTNRYRSSKRSSATSLSRAPSPAADTKSLTSFPSLSPTPDSSPVQARVNGWFRTAVGSGDASSQRDENKPTSPLDALKPMGLPDLPQPNAAPKPTVRKVTKSTQQLVGSLVCSTPSARERSALFDDTPAELDKIPGNLHCADNKHVEEALERMGAVALVKQLAGDLAQRDAQITALRRRAEERERILRKMLQECDVSYMDIEARLRDLDKSREQKNGGDNGLRRSRKRGSEYSLPGMHPEDPIDQRVALALEDDVSDLHDSSEFDHDSTLPEVGDVPVEVAPPQPRETARSNWRTFLWNGTSRKSSRAPSVASTIEQNTNVQTRSRASSGARQNRKPITNDLFLPPSDADKGAIPTLRRLQSQDQINSGTTLRKSSTSITNWALKMVAGNNQAGRSSDKADSIRGRKTNTSDSTDRTPSTASNRTTQSAKSALIMAQGRSVRTTLGPNGTIKSISGDASKNASAPSQSSRGLSNLGPVEMDMILPEESRPPTLVQHHNHFNTSHEYLTDRFGFIYDQRRKKRQSEAAAALSKQKRGSNMESLGDGRSVLHSLDRNDEAERVRPPPSDANDASGSPSPSRPDSRSSGEQGPGKFGKTWQDYLKLATHPTELLSHTPSTAPILETLETDVSAARASQVTVAKRGSLPSTSANPEPSPSRIVSGNAEFASPSSGPASPLCPYPPQADPVKALLEQLTELHDSLQRDKTVKWNEFLRKVRAERKREGDAATSGDGSKGLDMPETLLSDGEIIGVAGLGNKGKIGRAKWQEFRRLVLGGIPVSYRAKIWAECSGASALRIPGYYDDLIQNGVDNPSIVSQIRMDINRTLTDNIFFRKGPGVAKLNEVLLAYSRRNPEVGYCQGMNLITACLLLIMPTAEDAFWVLATMIENILPEKYYDQHLLTSRADQSVLREYVVELLPKLSAHLDALEIELEALTFQWFLSVFTDCLSAEALFRVWDVLLCMHDGSTFLFQVALALLKLNEKALLQCDTPAGVYHYINHQMTNHAISIDGLIQASDALNKVVKRKDVEERRECAVALEEKLIQQREEARQLRAKNNNANANKDTSISTSDVDTSTPPSVTSTRSETEDEGLLLTPSLEELTNRTPMPIEEESLWRG